MIKDRKLRCRSLAYCLFTAGLLPSIAAHADTFLITPQLSKVTLGTKMTTTKPFHFVVKNVDSKELTKLNFKVKENPRRLAILRFGTGKDACVQGGSLKQGATCYVYVNIKAPTREGSGSFKLFATAFDGFRKGESSNVGLDFEKNFKINLKKDVTKSIPQGVLLNHQYDHSVVFTNENPFIAATNVKMAFSRKSDDYKITNNTCGGSLQPLESCQIDGQLIPKSDKGSFDLYGIFTSDQSVQQSVNFSAFPEYVNITGAFSTNFSNKNNLEMGDEYPFTVTFANNSKHDASGVIVTQGYPVPAGIKILRDECSGILKAGASCELEARYKAENRVLSARLCDVVLLKQYGCFP